MPMPVGFEAELSVLLGLRLSRAFQNLPSDRERQRVVEYVEALSHKAETKVRSRLHLVASNLERTEQEDFVPGKIV
jgi:hypothetical protein